MKRGVLLIAVLGAMVLAPPARAQWSDDELMGEKAPPPGPRITLANPDKFYGPNTLSLVTSSDNTPYIIISANLEYPVPVAYTVATEDTLMLLHLRVWQSKKEYVPPSFMAPSDDFAILAVYDDCPGDTASFRMRKSEESG